LVLEHNERDLTGLLDPDSNYYILEMRPDRNIKV